MTLKEKVRKLPNKPGVYLMKDRLGSVLYVGKAKDLKKRVSTYFQPSRKLQVAQPKVAAMIDLIRDIETIEVKNEAEALLLEGRLIKEWRPRYNTDFTDDKRFLLVRLDVQNELPRFRLTRNRIDDGSRYFGPFANAGSLRRTLAQLRKEYGVLLGDAAPLKLPDGRWKLYDDARAEIYNSAEPITAQEYRGRVDQAAEVLAGKASEGLEKLREDMQAAAEAKNYERAAQLRDIIQSVEDTTRKSRKFTRQLNLQREMDERILTEAQEQLGMDRPPKVMECFDISHISGTFVVASMVQFENGRPRRDQYRRFKIKSFIGNDDFRAMEEVVGRRYSRLLEESKPFPDLIIIDGGRGQVSAALKAFDAAGIPLPPPWLIGLAKKEETVVFADAQKADLVLDRNSPVLHMLQRIRDEAHRFANSFNADLRSKRLRESVLDDFPGLGQVRKKALLEHFGGIQKLRKASEQELQSVEGIGPKLATQLTEFLNKSQKSKEEERADELFGPPSGQIGKDQQT